MIYLDNAATTFPKPEKVYDAVDYVQRNIAVNVGRGSYRVASEAMAIVDETRELMAQLVSAKNPNSIVFTPSATIAANEIIWGLQWDEYKTVYVSPFEHNAIARPLQKIKELFHVDIRLLPFDEKTLELKSDEKEHLFAAYPPDYVFINHVSNVTGTVLDVETIADCAKKYNAIVVVDGSQSVGLIKYNLLKSKIDYLIFAGHKNLYASWGLGGFIANTDNLISPFISGGTGSDSLNLSMNTTTPIGFEAGSPNIIAIASLNASLKWLNEIGVDTISNQKDKLAKRIINALSDMDGIVLYPPQTTSKYTGVISFNIDGYTSDEVGSILSSDFDIAVRTGYHCAPYIHDLIGSKEYMGTVRVSFGAFNTEHDADALIEAVRSIC